MDEITAPEAKDEITGDQTRKEKKKKRSPGMPDVE
jgi:hypothetical protein